MIRPLGNAGRSTPLLAALLGTLLLAGRPGAGALLQDPRGARISSPAGPAAGFDPGQSLDIFVGVRVFPEDPRIAEVPYAVDDAVDLAHLFSYELHLIAPQRVWLLLSGEAQKAATRQRLADLRAAGAQPSLFWSCSWPRSDWPFQRSST